MSKILSDCFSVDSEGPDARDLLQFTSRLLSLGYTEYLSSFSLEQYRPDLWLHYSYCSFGDLRLLIDFFLLNKSVHSSELDLRLGDCWKVLTRLDLVERDGDWVKMRGLVLIFYSGFFIFVDVPHCDPKVYFGDDSIGIFSRLAPLPGDSVLDLCAGSGIQGMKSVLQARRGTLVEIDPFARRILGINVLMNGLAERVEILGGSLFENISQGQRFDLVTANPPLVPFPDTVNYPFVGHGGIDGFAVTRKIIEGLGVFLSDRGRSQIIGLTLSDGLTLMIDEELRNLAHDAELDIRITLINHIPMSPSSAYFRGLVATASAVSKDSQEVIATVFGDELAKYDMSHLTSYYLLITRGSGSLRYQNLTRAKIPCLWTIRE